MHSYKCLRLPGSLSSGGAPAARLALNLLWIEQQPFSDEGVAGVEAEAELLAAMVMFFQRVGLSSKDVAIKISSRQLLQAVLEQHEVPADSTSRVFVTVDKMDKLPQETVISHSWVVHSAYTKALIVANALVPICVAARASASPPSNVLAPFCGSAGQVSMFVLYLIMQQSVVNCCHTAPASD